MTLKVPLNLVSCLYELWFSNNFNVNFLINLNKYKNFKYGRRCLRVSYI